MIMAGIVIGSGIFLTTGIMAKNIPSAPLILLAWFIGGLITLAGALTFAELGAALPKAGGPYVYLKEAYGSLTGFLYGWVIFLVYVTGGIAGLALAFAEYFGFFFPSLGMKKIVFTHTFSLLNLSIPYTLSAGQLVGVSVILFLSVIHYIGVGLGKIIQNIFTVAKIGTIAVIIILGLSQGKGHPIDFTLNPAGLDWGRLIVGFGISLVAVAWAFDGWNNINFVGGEIKKPERNLPLALILGTLGITVLYILINYIYLYALPVKEMEGVVRIAEKATGALFGSSTGALVSAAVIISTFSSINGSILVGPRVYYAMAVDKLFFRKVSKIHSRFKTPSFAILIQAIWASILTLCGSFEQIFTFAMFMAILFWIATAASVFTLRKKYPDLRRPYKTWGYPGVPIIFILASVGVLLVTLTEKPIEALAGIILTVLGIPVYYFWKKRSENNI